MVRSISAYHASEAQEETVQNTKWSDDGVVVSAHV